MHFISPKVSTGSFNDVEAMTKFAQQCDVLSLENEFIDLSIKTSPGEFVLLFIQVRSVLQRLKINSLKNKVSKMQEYP